MYGIKIERGGTKPLQVQRTDSRQVVALLAGLATVSPRLDSNTTIFVYIEANETAEGVNPMIINRPEFPISYLYNQPTRDVNVFALNEFRRDKEFATYDVNLDEIVLRKNGKRYPVGSIIAFQYTPGKDLEHLVQLDFVTTEGSLIPVKFKSPPSADMPELTKRQQYFVATTARQHLKNQD